MPRLDVEKAHQSIRSTLSNPSVVNQCTSVEVASKYSQKTGRTRIPPGESGTPANMSSKPAVNTTGASSDLKLTSWQPGNAAGPLVGSAKKDGAGKKL